jgi:hypothetical protein
MTTPSVGRVVHYVGPDERCTAAIVSDDSDQDALVLTTFAPVGPNVVAAVRYSETPATGTWHWPERV